MFLGFGGGNFAEKEALSVILNPSSGRALTGFLIAYSAEKVYFRSTQATLAPGACSMDNRFAMSNSNRP